MYVLCMQEICQESQKIKIGGRQYQTKPDQQEFHREHKGATLQGDIYTHHKPTSTTV